MAEAEVISFPHEPDPWSTIDDDDLLNDQTRAEAMARVWKGKAYYRAEKKNWIVWSEQRGRWLDESYPSNAGLWGRTCSKFLKRCATLNSSGNNRNGRGGANLQFGADTVLSHKVLASLIKLSQLQEEFILPEDRVFDQDTNLIGVSNGVLDLANSRLMPPSPSMLVSKHINIEYYPEARSNVWDKLLLDITGKDRDYRLFLREHFGAMLGGRNDLERFTILHGPGGSGKSTLGNTILDILGPYALQTNHDTFSRQPSGKIREDLAAFAGKRYVVDMELPDSQRLDTSVIKMLSGRDSIRARMLYQGGKVIKPTWSIVVSCNSLPALHPAPDSGFWRRVLVLPFTRRPKQPDRYLKDKLSTKAARRAILAWLVAGYRAYIRRPARAPVRLPMTVQAACAEYRMRYDHLSYWLETCTKSDPKSNSPNLANYASYIEFCEAYDIEDTDRVSAVSLGRYLTQQGYPTVRTHRGRGKRGIRIIEPSSTKQETSTKDEYEYDVNLTDFHV